MRDPPDTSRNLATGGSGLVLLLRRVHQKPDLLLATVLIGIIATLAAIALLA